MLAKPVGEKKPFRREPERFFKPAVDAYWRTPSAWICSVVFILKPYALP
jgi:hypothetical protein